MDELFVIKDFNLQSSQTVCSALKRRNAESVWLKRLLPIESVHVLFFDSKIVKLMPLLRCTQNMKRKVFMFTVNDCQQWENTVSLPPKHDFGCLHY